MPTQPDQTPRTDRRPTPVPVEDLPANERHAIEHAPTRTDRAVSWLGWHIAELTGVTLPALGAVAVSGWLATISAAVAAGWAGHEARLAHAQRKLTIDRQRRALAAVDTDDAADTGSHGEGDDGEQQGKGVSA